MDDDHVHAREFRHLLYLLHGHRTDMADELDLEVAGLRATVARTQIIGAQIGGARMKRLVDRCSLTRDKRRIEATVQGARQIEKGRIAFEFRKPQRGCTVDDGLEKLRHDFLRVDEAHVMEFHEPRITRDVGNHQERRLDAHRTLG